MAKRRRVYFVIAMGRKAGHLALGIGKAAGVTLTLILEEFAGHRVRLKTVVDTLVGAIIKRLNQGRRDGVAILAEGLVLGIDPRDLDGLEDVERDTHGNVRIAEVNLGEILKAQVQQRLSELGLAATIIAKNIGYELRCADPIPSDMEYTRDLGYCAARYVMEGGDAAMISMEGGRFVPIPFSKMVDPETGRARIRLVDITSTRYRIARRYMLRLRRDDFEDRASSPSSPPRSDCRSTSSARVRVSRRARAAPAPPRPRAGVHPRHRLTTRPPARCLPRSRASGVALGYGRMRPSPFCRAGITGRGRSRRSEGQ